MSKGHVYRFPGQAAGWQSLAISVYAYQQQLFLTEHLYKNIRFVRSYIKQEEIA